MINAMFSVHLNGSETTILKSAFEKYNAPKDLLRSWKKIYVYCFLGANNLASKIKTFCEIKNGKAGMVILYDGNKKMKMLSQFKKSLRHFLSRSFYS